MVFVYDGHRDEWIVSEERSGVGEEWEKYYGELAGLYRLRKRGERNRGNDPRET
jgi:hypothetical protein